MSQGEGQSGVIFPLAKQNCVYVLVVLVHVCACAYASARIMGICDHYIITKMSHSTDSCAAVIHSKT